MIINLTDLQHAALQMLADRYTEQEIADYLHTDRSTIRGALIAACDRMHVRHRDQAVRLARELGMLDMAGVVA